MSGLKNIQAPAVITNANGGQSAGPRRYFGFRDIQWKQNQTPPTLSLAPTRREKTTIGLVSPYGIFQPQIPHGETYPTPSALSRRWCPLNLRSTAHLVVKLFGHLLEVAFSASRRNTEFSECAPEVLRDLCVSDRQTRPSHLDVFKKLKPFLRSHNVRFQVSLLLR